MKVSIFEVYVFVLFMLVFSHLDSFRLHLTKLKSVLWGNLRLSVSMVLCGAGSSLQFPTSVSKPQTHYQFVIGTKSLVTSWIPSSVLIVLSTTNSVLKGKIYKKKVTEGWTARASNMLPLFLPLPLLQYNDTSWLFLVILNSQCQSASRRWAASQAEVRQCYHPFIVMVKSTLKLQDWDKCTFAGKCFRCVRADAHT